MIHPDNLIKFLNVLKIAFNFIRCFPHLVLFYCHKNRLIIRADVENWQQIRGHKYKHPIAIIYLLGTYREFRTLFYFRIGWIKYLLQFFCSGRSTLHIGTKNIGEKLYIHIGYSTIIGAKSIGKNCRIYQQVTIGSRNGAPIILDNVSIFSGAVIIGNITIGNNVKIGANATVFNSVPDNATVYPPNSRTMIWGKSDLNNDLFETVQDDI